MKHLLYLIPLFAFGCDIPSTTTKPATHVENRKESPVQELPPAPSKEQPATAREVEEPPATADGRPTEEAPPEKAPPIPEGYKPLNKAKTIFFEKREDGTRRVHLLAEVCLREGPLEVFLCKWNTKEHESILHVDADGRDIHLALIAAGAEPGSPVKFVPQYSPATGTVVKVSVTYREKGKFKTTAAGTWVKDVKTGKDMAHDWVFAGSKFFQDPERPNATPYYCANNGELISLANFPDSMLDLPVKSSKDAADLLFEIQTPRIPPLRTPVLVTLEPIVPHKK